METPDTIIPPTLTKELQCTITPEKALSILKAGNKRFMNQDLYDYDYFHQMESTSEAQHPFATVLGCMDSRVPVEILFNVGLGHLFVTRVAGNVVNEDILGSLEYGSAIVGASLIVVLGHTGCGAVGAAIADKGVGHVFGLTSKIQPAIYKVKSVLPESNAEFSDHVVRVHAQYSAEQISTRSTVIRKLVEEGKVKIVHAVYNLASGAVEFSE